MKVVYNEWGRYQARIEYDIDIDDINKELTENFPDAEFVTEDEIAEILNGNSVYNDTVIKDNGEEYSLADVIFDIIEDCKCSAYYKWEMVDCDTQDQEFSYIEFKGE